MGLLCNGIEPLEDRRLLAAPELVLDINRHTSNGSDPAEFTAFQDKVYFVATDVDHGRELWKLDPRGLGAALESDLIEGPRSSAPRELTRLGETLFFTAVSDNGTRELWRIDHANKKPVRVLAKLADGRLVPLSDPARLEAKLDLLFFESAVDGGARQVWRTDGTAEGAIALTQLERGLADRVTPLDPFAEIGRTIYFGVNHLGTSRLWKTDGSVAGTYLILELSRKARDRIEYLTPVGDRLFFRYGPGLWVSDGTSAGTALLRDFQYSIDPPTSPTAWRGALYFVADGSLWRSDGTTDGTARVRNGVVGIVGVLHGELLFQTEPAWRQYELWITDGRDDGAERLAELGGRVHGGQEMDGWFYSFDSGANLWRTNGTAAGTERIASNLTGHYVTPVGGYVYFSGAAGDSGADVWRIDSATARVELVAKLNFKTDDSDPALSEIQVGGFTYFVADDGLHGRELWKTDGTTEGTTIVADVQPGPEGSNPRIQMDYQGFVFFTTERPEPAIWRGNGTPAGTQLLVLVDRVPELSLRNNAPQDVFVASHEGVFFSTKNARYEVEYWVADISRGIVTGLEANGSFAVLGRLDGDTYYIANQQLWRRRGGQNMLIRDLANEPITTMYPDPTLLYEPHFATGDELYFGRHAGELDSGHYVWESRQVWKTDGTAAGTVQVDDYPFWPDVPHYVGDSIFFFHTPDRLGDVQELWFTDDGSLERARLVKRFPSFVDAGHFIQGQRLLQILDAVTYQGLLYFSAGDFTHGNELWRSDGTPEGTFVLKDIVLGETSSDPNNLTVVGDHLYFTASNGAGYWDDEIWISDGTSEGTRLVYHKDDRGALACRNRGHFGCTANPTWTELGEANGYLLLVDDDPSRGSELYRVSSKSVPRRGDVNTDGRLNAADIDAIHAAIRERYEFHGPFGPAEFKDRSAVYDVNFDDAIDQNDVLFLVEAILGTRTGDLDLDGDVDFTDFLQLSAHFGKTDSGWEMGDLDGDGETTFADFLLLSAAFSTPL